MMKYCSRECQVNERPEHRIMLKDIKSIINNLERLEAK